jgi:hypothetical protein
VLNASGSKDFVRIADHFDGIRVSVALQFWEKDGGQVRRNSQDDGVGCADGSPDCLPNRVCASEIRPGSDVVGYRSELDSVSISPLRVRRRFRHRQHAGDYPHAVEGG